MNVPVEGSRHPDPRMRGVVSVPAHKHHRNAALAALSPGAFSILEPHLRLRDFEEGSVLWDAGEPVNRAYFPLSGVISIVLPVKDGGGVEVASIGYEGGAGVDCEPGHHQSVTQGIAQVAGTFSYISALQFASAAKQNDEIGHVAALCCNWLLTQSQLMAACNAVHSAEARFCRWLLLSADRLESDVVPVTQEAIARALGIRRTTITLIAQGLQTSGLISYRRGKIAIRDRGGLRSAACDCCAVLGRRNWPSERLVAEVA